MVPGERETPPVKKEPQRKGRLTVMIIRSVGQVRSFKISPHILFWAILFFVLYIPTSVFVFNKYMQLYRASSTQSRQIELLKEEISNSKRSFADSNYWRPMYIISKSLRR